ncbi:hypothetical protein [Desulfovibrio gilichinskyi]|uniref:Uncharacterized protein n=1 Tax=Desulfovibrio gilichinskyi TaxID=1519643 RepID=A0A1X7C8H3_9BACT|nr:hypothetical protein [Desulfovibrio gilichinskyi]SME92005.1 hypothetical protein SAMN06295933_0503 [Desulfovibrio gilichinskyi]
MINSASMLTSGTAGSYFSNIANESAKTSTPQITKEMTPSQIRRQLQMQFASQSFGLTSDEQQQVGSYFSQINNIYGVDDSKLRKEEEAQFKALKTQLDDLYGLSGEPKKLTVEEQAKVDEIQSKLDKLYDILPTKEPTGSDLKRAESLKWELRKLYYPDGKVLTAAEKKVESSIQSELKELFGIHGPKTLTEEEQTTADELRKQMDEINGTTKKELTADEKEKADDIIKKMEELAGKIVTHGLSNIEKTLYNRFDERLDELTKLSKERSLTEKEQAELKKTNENINTLLDKAAKIQDQQDAQANQVYSQMNGFFSQMGMGYSGGGTLLSTRV